MSEASTSPEAAELIRQICGTDLNGGLIRDLCFTVWSICHNPTHEDGNADWGDDTLPTVQAGVAKVRNMLRAALTSPPKAGAGEPRAWEGYWPGAGSVNSQTSFTRSHAEMERWRRGGAEITPLYATPEPRRDGVREEDGDLDAGINYAIERLCEVLDVDPKSISWDAATETMDGDVMSVICNVLRAAYGEEWSTKPEDTARIRAALTSPASAAIYANTKDLALVAAICQPGTWADFVARISTVLLPPTADRIATLERELDEAQTLRHKAEYHAGVLEAQNVVLRREPAEAQKERDRYGRLYLDEIDRAISIDDELVASKAEVERLRAALRKMHRRAQRAEGHVQAVHHALTMWRGKRIMKERDGYLARAIVDNVLAELNRRIRRALTRQGETG